MPASLLVKRKMMLIFASWRRGSPAHGPTQFPPTCILSKEAAASFLRQGRTELPQRRPQRRGHVLDYVWRRKPELTLSDDPRRIRHWAAERGGGQLPNDAPRAPSERGRVRCGHRGGVPALMSRRCTPSLPTAVLRGGVLPPARTIALASRRRDADALCLVEVRPFPQVALISELSVVFHFCAPTCGNRMPAL